MKVRKKFWILFVVPMLILASCKDNVKEKYLQDITQLSSTLDEYQQTTKEFDNQQTSTMVTSVKATLSSIKRNFKSDTLPYQIIDQINTYKEIPNAVSVNSGNLAKVKLAIPEVQKKLADLKHDIENGVNERAKYEEYIAFEEEKVNEIGEVLDYFLKINKKYTDLYDSLQPEMQAFQDQLEKEESE